MRAFVGALVFAVVVLAFVGNSHADYLTPEVSHFMAHEKATVAILEIDHLDEETGGHLVVEETLLGEVLQSEMNFVAYSCFGSGLHYTGIQAGERYVMLILGTSMFEERSYFPIDDRDVIDLGQFYSEWFGFDSQTVSLADFRTRLAELSP